MSSQFTTAASRFDGWLCNNIVGYSRVSRGIGVKGIGDFQIWLICEGPEGVQWGRGSRRAWSQGCACDGRSARRSGTVRDLNQSYHYMLLRRHEQSNELPLNLIPTRLQIKELKLEDPERERCKPEGGTEDNPDPGGVSPSLDKAFFRVHKLLWKIPTHQR